MNPWPNHAPRSRRSRSGRHMPKAIAITFCSAPILWFFLWLLEERLVSAGVLNKKDMTFVGNETGTAWEYLMNAWHWDAALMVLLLVALFCPIIGILLLMSGRRKHDSDAA